MVLALKDQQEPKQLAIIQTTGNKSDIGGTTDFFYLKKLQIKF